MTNYSEFGTIPAMEEKKLFKQIENIVKWADYENAFQDALSKDDKVKALELWADRASGQLDETQELAEKALNELVKTSEALMSVYEIADEMMIVCGILDTFIEQTGLIPKFEEWAEQNNQIKTQLENLEKRRS